VCFITSEGGRQAFLAERLAMTPGRVVDGDGREVGRVDAVELVTAGQRRGLGLAGGTEPRYAVAVDVPGATVTVGRAGDLLVDEVAVEAMSWVGEVVEGLVEVQCSAHGGPRSAVFDARTSVVRFDRPSPRVAPGQSVVLYRGDEVLGGGTAT
jgi:tRNA-specific 2-thiouridylase